MRRTLAALLLLGCASSEEETGTSGAPGTLSLTVDGVKADFTGATATATGPPFNRLSVFAHRGADPMLEELQVTAAGDSPLHEAAYSCADQSETAIFYAIGDEAFDDGGDCTITLTRAGTGAGQEVAGSFSGVVTDGSAKKTLAGTFRVNIRPSL